MSFDLSPNHAVDDPVPQRSRSIVEGVLIKAQFSSPLLYQIHCIEPVGFGFAHIYSERSPPNQDPTYIFCASPPTLPFFLRKVLDLSQGLLFFLNFFKKKIKWCIRLLLLFYYMKKSTYNFFKNI